MKRWENESFSNYKKRRAELNKAIKQAMKGRVFHNSSRDGTYHKQRAVNNGR